MSSASEAETLRIVGGARRIVIGQLLLPSIELLKAMPGNTKLSQAQFFRLIGTERATIKAEDGPPASLLMGGGPLQAVESAVKYSLTDNDEMLTVSEPGVELAQDTVWGDVVNLVQRRRKRSRKASVSFMSPKNTASFLSSYKDAYVEAQELIALAGSASESPVISAAQSAILLAKLDKFEDEDELDRNEFVVHVREWSIDERELDELDLERLTLYLFPELDVEIYILRKLIAACAEPSQHTNFTAVFAKLRVEQLSDMYELMIYAPFLILFLFVVFSGKFVTPRTYYGADATSEVNSKIFAASFNQLGQFPINFSAPQTTTISTSEIAAFPDIYAFLYNGIGSILWTDPNLDASGTVVGRSLRLVGALKIRNMRVLPVPSPVLSAAYFGNGTARDRYPGLDVSNIDPTSIPLMNTSSYAQFVTPPWDGSTFGTCTALNGSGALIASTSSYGCSGNAAVIPFRRTQSEYQAVIEGLAANNWIGASTRAISVEFHLFHPVSTMMVFVGCVIEIRAGGGLSVTTKVQPYAFNTLTSSSLSVTIAFYVFFVYLVFLFVRVIPIAFRPLVNKSEKLPVDYWRLWDFVNLSIFVAAAILRLTYIAQGKPSDPVWLMEHYPQNYEKTQELFNLMSTVDSFNVIMSVLALLRYTKFVPGLDVVVNSLQIAAADAVALIFIIAGTFMSFVLCANTAFGDQVYGYHTVPWACETLGQVFMGNYDFSSLHAAHPTFAFIYFFFFNIMLTMILLSCFVAVFTDAFGDARSNSTNGDQIRLILAANPRHNFHPSSFGASVLCSSVVQYIRHPLSSWWAKNIRGEVKPQTATSEIDDLSYRGYYQEVKKSLDLIFAVGDKDVKAKSRVNAAFVLLTILDKIPVVQTHHHHMLQAALEKDSSETTRIYSFMEDHLGKFDYPLCVSFFVLAPQERFSLPGEESITQLLGCRSKWFDTESRTALKASDVDWLELRVRAVVEERTRRNSAVTSFAFGDLAATHHAVSVSYSVDEGAVRVVKNYIDSLDYIHRRLFVGLVGLAAEHEIQPDVLLTKDLLFTLIDRCSGFPLEELSQQDVWDALRIGRVAPPMHMMHAHAAAIADLSEQCLSLDLSVSEIKELQRIIEHASGSTPPLTVTPRPDEQLGSGSSQTLFISREEFVAAWKALRGTPSEAMVNKIFSIFPSGMMNVSVFLSFARGNLSTHRFMSIQRSFTERMEARIKYLSWLIFYIPFVALILYFVDIQHGDHIWVVQSMLGSFPTSDGVEVADVNSFMTNAVGTIWGTSPIPGSPLSINGANYFVGAIRFRQHRVGSVNCQRVFTDYFGDAITKSLAFPTSIIHLSTADQDFYSNNVKVAYNRLVSNFSCYSAWDLGQSMTTIWDDLAPQPIVVNSSIPEVIQAFRYDSGNQLATSDPVYAHNSEYPSGGFGLVINTSVSADYAAQAVADLIANNWIDERTRTVLLEFVVLNFNLDLYCRVRVGYEVTGGGILRAVNSMYIVDHHDLLAVDILLPAIIMLIFLIIYLVVWGHRFVDALQTRIHNYGDALWIAPWMTLVGQPILLVDAVIIGTFLTTFVMRVSTSQYFGIVGGITNKGNYATQAEGSATLVQTMFKLMGVNVLLVFLRFLEIISTMQPRIATFYSTLRCAAKDLLSIISLWIFSLFAFTLAGVILFGYGTPQAFNLQNEFFDIFNTASGGNVNYYDYTMSRRIAASAFFGIFFIVCFFVLYNMVVAVLTEQFSITKGGLYDDSVAQSILGEPKPKTWRKWFSNLLLIRELNYFLNKLRFGDEKMPLALQHKSPRRLWRFLAAMWQKVDVGEPREVAVAAGTLMALSFAAERHLRKEDELSLSLSEAKSFQRQRTFAELRNSHRGGGGALDASTSINSVTRLRTIVDRRQPLWEEFVFYRFGNERDCIHRYLVWLPSVLLGTHQRELWLDVFEEDHYFSLERDVYTVDLSESKIVEICKILPEMGQVALDATSVVPAVFSSEAPADLDVPHRRAPSIAVVAKEGQQEDETTPFIPADSS